jgi:hypothetical protein
MSIKVYYAYRFKGHLGKALKKLQKAYIPVYKAQIRKNAKAMKLDPTAAWVKMTADRMKMAKETGVDYGSVAWAFPILECSFALIQRGPYTYIIPPEPIPALLKHGFEDYGYWNNVDEDPSVSAKDWAARERAWKAILSGTNWERHHVVWEVGKHHTSYIDFKI